MLNSCDGEDEASDESRCDTLTKKLICLIIYFRFFIRRIHLNLAILYGVNKAGFYVSRGLLLFTNVRHKNRPKWNAHVLSFFINILILFLFFFKWAKIDYDSMPYFPLNFFIYCKFVNWILNKIDLIFRVYKLKLCA